MPLRFLIEAVVLSAAGGFIGIALGMEGALARVARTTHWLFVFTPFWIVASFGNIHGDRQAARMNPIDALRFE